MTTADPDWNQVDTVLVDLDGTLLDLGFDDRFWRGRIPRAYAAHHGIGPDEAWHRLAGLFETTRGTLDWYCIDYWSRTLDLDIAALKRAARHEVAWLPGAREFLGRVRATGRRLVLVTNAHPEALAIKDSHAGVIRWLDRAISSHEFGAPKEHDVFWTALASREGIEPARTVFLDDSPEVLRAALRFGVGHVIGMREPVAGAPPRSLDGFSAVAGVRDLIAGLDLAGRERKGGSVSGPARPDGPADPLCDQVVLGGVGG